MGFHGFGKLGKPRDEHGSFHFQRQQHKSALPILSVSVFTMKILVIFALSAALIQPLHAQGTLKFQVEANGRGAIPPNNSLDNAGGPFYLLGNLFSGDVGFTTEGTSGGMLLAIRDAAGSVIFPADRIQWEDVGAPFAFGYAFWDERPLTVGQIDDLMAGNWYLVMSNNEYPNGELRGQLQLVPEPSIFALLGLGLALFWILKSKRRRIISLSSEG